jgi:4-amino-4-deoxy-L-arabinose transferase-like glycosyltransferase
MLASGSYPGPASRQPRTALRSAYRVAVLALLVIIAGEIFLSTRQQSQTFDEADHLYAGYEYWKHADFGRNPEHPPLMKLVAASALLSLPLKEPAPVSIPFFKAQDFYTASTFLYSADADSLLARGRGMLLIFSLGLALAVFAAGREMFGTEAGLLALVLFALEPMILANGGLITSDMPLACLMFCSVYTFYRYVRRPSAGRLAVCAIAAGLTVAVKQSGIFVFLILGLIVIAELLLKRAPATEQDSHTGSATPWRTAVSLALALAIMAAISYAMLWAFYGFRYAARPAGLSMAPSLDIYAAGISSKFETASILSLARHHLLPEAYLYGWTDILRIPGARTTFLFGKLYSTIHWYLFPAVFVVKSTITLLILLACIPLARLWRRSREFLFLTIPAVTYLLIAINSGINAHARYMLPIYPFCIVLAGAAAWHIARQSRVFAIGVAVLIIFAEASSLHAFPDYLAYSNEAFGGPAHTYRLVSDSSNDWGQGLKWTKTYLDANRVTDCWFNYSIPFADPKYYGIDCKPLVSSWTHVGLPTAAMVPETISGTILLSAMELDGQLWGPDVLNPYDQFSHLRPDAIPGNVILVYHGTFHVPLLAAYSHSAAADRLAARQEMPEAVAEAEEAARLAPDSADIQARLGRTLMAAGRTQDARQANAKALQIARSVHPEFQVPLIAQLEATAAATETPK